MECLLLSLWNRSAAAGWLILAVVVLRLFLKKAPKWISCLLWALVAFRLVWPFSIESALSLIPSSEPLPENIVAAAKDLRGMYGRRTILFVDEIHRFNKAQQDYLLPFVEDGTVILIGATTENPYFEVRILPPQSSLDK